MMEIIPDWYKSLVDDCSSIVTEAEFNSRWSLVEGYHELGVRILADANKFDSEESVASCVSRDIGKSVRTVERAIQFAKKFPDLNLLPEGKDTSWHKIVNKLLPEHSSKEEKKHVCPSCGYKW